MVFLKNISRKKWLIILGILICLLFYYVSFLMNSFKDVGEKRYTVGGVGSTISGRSSSTNYFYRVKDKWYESYSPLSFKKYSRYLVRYAVKDPTISVMLPEYKVKEDVFPPDTGWTNIPKGIFE